MAGRSSSRDRAASRALAMRATSANPTRSIISRFAARFTRRTRSLDAARASTALPSSPPASRTRSKTLISPHPLRAASREA